MVTNTQKVKTDTCIYLLLAERANEKLFTFTYVVRSHVSQLKTRTRHRKVTAEQRRKINGVSLACLFYLSLVADETPHNMSHFKIQESIEKCVGVCAVKRR